MPTIDQRGLRFVSQEPDVGPECWLVKTTRQEPAVRTWLQSVERAAAAAAVELEAVGSAVARPVATVAVVAELAAVVSESVAGWVAAVSYTHLTLPTKA